MSLLIVLAVFAAVAYRVVAPDDRARYVAIALEYLRQLKATAAAPRPEHDAFLATLRDRSPRLVIVPAIVALNVGVAAAMLAGSGALSDPATLLRWGANLGTRTTNGEWWRLLTSTFVHTGVFQLVLEILVLPQLGAIVERLIGRAALAVAYVSAGAIAGLRQIASRPVDVATGTSAAICGAYGLVAACVLWQLARSRREPAAIDEEPAAPPRVTIPLIAIKRLAVVGVAFLVGSAIDGFATAAELTGFFVGIAFGAVLGWRAAERVAGIGAVGATCAACAVAGVVYAMPLRNIADVKPEVDRVIALEARTSAAYQDAFDRFSHQRLSADALADLADGTIVPELQAADARLGTLRHVPAEHQQPVADAREFLRLRSASWHARADALRGTHRNLRAAGEVGGDAGARVRAEGRFRSTMAAAGRAEAAERTASEAFARVKRYSWRPIAE